MPITTWIRDLLGIRKDYVGTEKNVLEIEKLEAEKDQRITPASFEDVKKYDPNYQKIELRAEEARKTTEIRRYRQVPNISGLVFLVLIIVLLYSLFQRFC